MGLTQESVCFWFNDMNNRVEIDSLLSHVTHIWRRSDHGCALRVRRSDHGYAFRVKDEWVISGSGNVHEASLAFDANNVALAIVDCVEAIGIALLVKQVLPIAMLLIPLLLVIALCEHCHVWCEQVEST